MRGASHTLLHVITADYTDWRPVFFHGKYPELPDNRLAPIVLQVDRMVSDAEKFSEEDKKQREAVDIRNSVCPACLPALN